VHTTLDGRIPLAKEWNRLVIAGVPLQCDLDLLALLGLLEDATLRKRASLKREVLTKSTIPPAYLRSSW